MLLDRNKGICAPDTPEILSLPHAPALKPLTTAALLELQGFPAMANGPTYRSRLQAAAVKRLQLEVCGGRREVSDPLAASSYGQAKGAC